MQFRQYQNALLSDEFKASAFFRWDSSAEMQDVKGTDVLIPAAGTTPVAAGSGLRGDPIYDLGSGSLQRGDAGHAALAEGHAFLLKLSLTVGAASVDDEFRTLAVFGDPSSDPSICFTSRRYGTSLYLTLNHWTGVAWNPGYTTEVKDLVESTVRFYLWAGNGRAGIAFEGDQAFSTAYTGVTTGEALISIGSYAQALAVWPSAPAPYGAGSANSLRVETVAAIPSIFFLDGGIASASPIGGKPELLTLFHMDIKGYRKTKSGSLPPLDNSRSTLLGSIDPDSSSFYIEHPGRVRVPGPSEVTHVSLSNPDGTGTAEVVTVIDVDSENGQLVVARSPGSQSWPAGTVVAGWVVRRTLEVLPDTDSKLPTFATPNPPIEFVVKVTEEFDFADGTFTVEGLTENNFVVVSCGLVMYGENGTTFDLSMGYGVGGEALLSAVTLVTVTGDWSYVRHQAALIQGGLVQNIPSQLSFTIDNLSAPGNVYGHGYFMGFHLP